MKQDRQVGLRRLEEARRGSTAVLSVSPRTVSSRKKLRKKQRPPTEPLDALAGLCLNCDLCAKCPYRRQGTIVWFCEEYR